MRLPSRTITIRCYHPSYSYTDPEVAQFSNIAEYREYGSTKSTSLGWNNQRRGQKRVVRLLPREIVRYTRGVIQGGGEIFPREEEAKEIYRPSRTHKARGSGRFFGRLNRPDIIYSVARSDREANTRISRISGGGVAGGRGGREGRVSPDGREGNKAATRPYI